MSSSSDTIIQQEPLALYQLTDVASDDNGVIGAVEGAVLKFDGTNWYGDKIEIDIPEGGVEYLFKQVFSKIFTAYDINGNIVDITDINSIINNISVNYNFWSKGYVSALGKQNNESTGGVTALHQLIDVAANDENTAVKNAEKGSVLTYDGTHWYGSKISGNGVITDTYSKKEIDDKISEVDTSINNTNTRIDNLIQLVEKEEDAINGVDGVLYILQ